ncbi:hypothetical protein DRO32_00780, partial [Candidatus Bathyarchaeota archaeon]
FLDLVRGISDLAGSLVEELASKAEELVRERAPRRSGALARSVGSEVRGSRALVGVRARYAPFLEWGTRPHEIRPRSARALRFPMGGRLVFARRVLHPGIKPRFFVLSALEALRDELGRVLGGVLDEFFG